MKLSHIDETGNESLQIYCDAYMKKLYYHISAVCFSHLLKLYRWVIFVSFSLCDLVSRQIRQWLCRRLLIIDSVMLTREETQVRWPVVHTNLIRHPPCGQKCPFVLDILVSFQGNCNTSGGFSHLLQQTNWVAYLFWCFSTKKHCNYYTSTVVALLFTPLTAHISIITDRHASWVTMENIYSSVIFLWLGSDLDMPFLLPF